MTAVKTVRFQVHVQPGASKTQIVGAHGDGIKVRIAAPPVDGAANEALIELLARRLGVPKGGLHIVRGTSGRQKLIEIGEPYAVECRSRLAALLGTVDKGEPRR